MKKFDEHYSATRPVTCVCNLIIGTMYLDLDGETECVNHSTGEKITINFIKQGWFDSEKQKVDGYAFDEEGNKVYRFHGSWSKAFYMTELSTGDVTTLWEAHSYPDNYDQQFNFTQFAINLNSLPSSLKHKLAPTDSRFRQDQRALEEGDIDLAAKEKHRLEEKQRRARKIRKDEGDEWEPRYFE